MGTTLNKETYEKLIKADLEALSQLPSSLEKEHIISVLNDSVDFYYQPRAGEEQETSDKAGLLADVIDWALVADKQPPSDIEVMASDGVDVEFDKYGDRYSNEWNNLHYTYKFWAYKPKPPSL